MVGGGDELELRVRGVLNSASVHSLALVPELKLLHRKLRKAAWTNAQKFGAPISSPFIRTSPPVHYSVREKQRGAQGEYASANRVGHCGSAMQELDIDLDINKATDVDAFT